MRKLSFHFVAAGLWFALTCACQTAPDSRAGVLVIAGGAVEDAGPVMPRFFHEAQRAAARMGAAQAVVEVVPTASGDPQLSLTRNVEDMGWIATGPTVQGVFLPANNPYTAEDEAIAQRLAAAQAIWFTGGDQNRIVSLFRPGGYATPDSPMAWRSTPIDVAVHEALAKGAVIAGSSAGAAMMSSPMIGGGNSEDALLHGASEAGVQVGRGMDFYPFGITDQHFLARGRIGRLLVALQATGERFGAGIEENSAWVVTLGERPMCEALGMHAVCLLDMGESPTPAQFNAWHAELSLLGTGDRWDPLANELHPRSGRIPAPRVPVRTTHTSAEGSTEAAKAPGAWDKGALIAALLRLSRNPAEPQYLFSDHFRVTLSAGPQTRFLVSPNQGLDLYAERVELRIDRVQVEDPRPNQR